MKYTIKFLDQYVIDLGLTLGYIANNLYNSDAAINLRNAVDEKIDEIEANPFIFSVHSWKVKHNHEYRKAKVKNYYIFFFVKHNEITIARFVYSRMDLDNINF